MGQEETEERIVIAAAELFAERGYVGTTTSTIAAKAGVNEVTLFRRFGSKEGILRALSRIAAASRPEYPPISVVVPGDLRATLRNLAAIEVRDAIQSGGLAIRLAFEARSVPEVRAALGDTLPSNLERFTTYLRPFQEEGVLRRDIDLELISEAFYSLTSSFVMYRIAIGERDLPHDSEIERIAEKLVEIFWSGTGGSGPERSREI